MAPTDGLHGSPPDPRQQPGSPPGDPGASKAPVLDLRSLLAGIERDLIRTALRDSRGNKARAARSLGISERLMGIRVKKLGIDWRAYRTRGLARPGP